MDDWEVFGLGGLWRGKARDETDAILKAKAAGVLIVSWSRKLPS